MTSSLEMQQKIPHSKQISRGELFYFSFIFGGHETFINAVISFSIPATTDQRFNKMNSWRKIKKEKARRHTRRGRSESITSSSGTNWWVCRDKHMSYCRFSGGKLKHLEFLQLQASRERGFSRTSCPTPQMSACQLRKERTEMLDKC